MFINTFQYKPEDVDCTLCTEYKRIENRKKKQCTAEVCPWLAERIEAGVVNYEEAVYNAFPHDPKLAARLRSLVQSFHGSLFLDPGHKRRMEAMKVRAGFNRRRDTSAYYAAMYLLTANPEINRRAANCFCRSEIEFSYATTKDISEHEYTLLCAARDIYEDSGKVMLNDLASREVVDAAAFSLIVNALLVARYGPAVLDITERSKA